jgi:hypothetical protein
LRMSRVLIRLSHMLSGLRRRLAGGMVGGSDSSVDLNSPLGIRAA